MKSPRILLALVAASLMLGACASDARLRDADRLALYREHAGPPVDSFHYFGSLSGWTPLGDSAIAIWTKPAQAYLLEVHGPCPDLEFAHAIGLSQQMGRVYARFDKVIPLGTTGMGSIPCHIREIRALDVKAIKSAEREARARAQASGR
ncbi:MAG TPA: DUF6491 family protein [Lysobacter sp.]